MPVADSSLVVHRLDKLIWYRNASVGYIRPRLRSSVVSPFHGLLRAMKNMVYEYWHYTNDLPLITSM